MVLRMARPTKNPKTSNYQFRKRVPADVRRLIGGPAIVKVTLGTKDPTKAVEEFRRRDAEFETRWAEVRKGIQDLDHEAVEAIGGEVYRDLMARPGKNRGVMVAHSYAWFRYRCETLDTLMDTALPEDWWPDVEALHGPGLDRVLHARGMTVTAITRERLLLAAHRAGRQAACVIVRQATGDYSPDLGADRFPTLPDVKPAGGRGEFEAVWAAWAKEALPSENTVKRWRPVLDRMLTVAGTTDLGAISEDTLQDWVDSLLGELSNNTVAKVHLAAVKCMFKYAKSKKRILVNPAQDLSVKSGTKYEIKMRAYRDDEAAIILKACLEAPSDRMTPYHRDARRWVPWLCAYTGARVNEITQLRACDVKTLYGCSFIEITEHAGTVKTGDRSVPLHPDLKRQGFLDFVETKSGDEPLFYAATRRRAAGEGGMPPYEEMGARLSKWVRRLGFDDEHIDPNHAWRHRFKRLAFRFGIQEKVADQIQGHAPTTAGRRYGEAEIIDMYAAIRRIPRFDPDDLSAYTIIPEPDDD